MSGPRAYICVATGSALGAVLRYLAGLPFSATASLPWDTLLVNTTGALAIGVLVAMMIHPGRPAARGALQYFLIPGLLAGYTTFSVFSLQTMQLLQEEQIALAMLNILANILLALAAVVGGHAIGTRIRQRRVS